MKTITVSVPQEKLEAFDRATKVIALIAAAESTKVSVSSIAVDAVIAYGAAQGSRLAALLAAVSVGPQTPAPAPAPAPTPVAAPAPAPKKPKRAPKEKPEAPAPTPNVVLETLGVPSEEPKS